MFVLMRFFCNYKHIERDKEAVRNNQCKSTSSKEENEYTLYYKHIILTDTQTLRELFNESLSKHCFNLANIKIIV